MVCYNIKRFEINLKTSEPFDLYSTLHCFVETVILYFPFLQESLGKDSAKERSNSGGKFAQYWPKFSKFWSTILSIHLSDLTNTLAHYYSVAINEVPLLWCLVAHRG